MECGIVILPATSRSEIYFALHFFYKIYETLHTNHSVDAFFSKRIRTNCTRTHCKIGYCLPCTEGDEKSALESGR